MVIMDNHVLLKNRPPAIIPPTITCNNKLPVPGSMYSINSSLTLNKNNKTIETVHKKSIFFIHIYEKF